MNNCRTLSLLAIIFLAACQTDQYIPVNPPASQAHASPTVVQYTSTPNVLDPRRSSQLAEPSDVPPIHQSTSTPTLVPSDGCSQATFVSDVTIPDGSILRTEQIFLKIWRLKNSGECAWPDDLRLIFIAGDPMGAGSEIQAHTYPQGLPLIASLGERAWAEGRQVVVQSEEIIDIPVLFQAPGIAGDHYSLWALRARGSDDDLIQIYLDIQVSGPETPVPSTWGGVWQQINLHADEDVIALAIEQRDVQVRGFFYATDGALFLLEGGLFDQYTRVEGTFGPPYHDGYPFIWQITTDRLSFQGLYRDQIVSTGAWCGARSENDLPDPCILVP